MNRFSILPALAICLTAISAVGAELGGSVRDAASGLPVAGAVVCIPALAMSTETATDGSFVLADIAEGSHDLVVLHPYYNDWKQFVATGGDPLSIQLEPRHYTLEPLVVTATGYDRLSMDTSLPVNVIDAEWVEKRVSLSMSELFIGQAGLDVSTTGAGSVRPMIRGLCDERVLILVDGIRLSEQRPGGNHVLSLDPAQIDHIEVVRGPASVIHGSDAIGGVMNFITKKADRDTYPGWRFHMDQTAAYESASEGWKASTHMRCGKDRLNVHLGGQFRDSDNIETPRGELPHSFYEGGTLWAGANYEADGWRTRIGYTFMRADIGIPAGPVFLADFFDDEKHHTLNASLVMEDDRWPFTQFKLDVGWQRHNRHRYRLRTPPGPSVQENLEIQIWLDIDTYFLQPQLVLAGGDRHTLTTGAQFFCEDATSDRSIVDTSPGSDFSHSFNEVPVIPPSKRMGVGLYLQDEIEAGGKFVVTPGIRFDDTRTESEGHPEHQVSDELSVEDRAVAGNLGLLFRLSPQVNLYANAGRAFRAPTLLERFFFGPHDAAKDDIGNPDLEPETSWNLDLGVKTKSNRWRAQLSLFHNAIQNYIVKVDADSAMLWQNLDKVTLYGGECSLEYWSDSGFTVFGELSYVVGEDDESGQDLPAIPPLRAHYGLRYDRDLNGERRLWGEAAAITSAHQNRPGSMEKETEAWTRIDLRAEFQFSANMAVIAAVENVTDEFYHDHLSRAWQDLDLDDQPGRNAKLHVRLSF